MQVDFGKLVFGSGERWYKSKYIVKPYSAFHPMELAYISKSKGVLNHSNQLSNYSHNLGTQRGKTESHEFHGLTLPYLCYFTEKHVKYLEISLEKQSF